MESTTKPTENTIEEEKKPIKQKVDGIKTGFIAAIKDKTNAFISQMANWTDEDFKIPSDLIKGIAEAGFDYPSKIQAVAIPMIAPPDEKPDYQNLIAQSKNGSGKTGSFTIGTLLRVDPNIKAIQVIAIAHTRELVMQIATVYEKLVKFTDIKVDTEVKTGTEHVLVLTLSSVVSKIINSRKKINLSNIKCLVIDEADIFFNDQKNFDQLQVVLETLYVSKPQMILFSATYSDEVRSRISKIVSEAQQINVKTERLNLDNIQQYEYQCPTRGKVDWMEQLYQIENLPQTIIFVNFKKIAEMLYRQLLKRNCKPYIVMGGISNEERDEIVSKFRKQEINTLITTNLLSRGIDIPEIKIVINFDVPKKQGLSGNYTIDEENYLHRIGRTGRFNTQGIAINLYDNEDDQKLLYETLEHYKYRDKLMKLRDVNHVAEIFNEMLEKSLMGGSI